MARSRRAGGASPPGERLRRRHFASPRHPSGKVETADSALARLPGSAATRLHSLTPIGRLDLVTSLSLTEFGPNDAAGLA